MAKADEGHRLTERQLADLEHRIAELYKEAADEVQGEIDAYFESFRRRDEEMKARLDAGEVTKEYYTQWRLNQMGRGERYQALRDKLAKRYTEANATAVAYTNDATPGIYTLNRNYAAYTIEAAGANVDFTLWDEQTVRRLAVEQPNLMPYYPKERALKRGIDLAYGKRQITASVTSSILQGKSIKGMADDLQRRLPEMNRSSAIRTARTAVTGAQNAGRQAGYEAAEKMGIKLKKKWMATLDSRTRHAHAELDGQMVASNKPFEVDGYKLMYPGDTSAPAYLTYNCRCTVSARPDDLDTTSGPRRARDPITGKSEVVSGMTYKEWWAAKEAQYGAEKSMRRRRVGDQGQEIIDKPTYAKLTRRFIKSGGVIIRGEEAQKHLEKVGAYAAYFSGGNVAFIRDDATVSDVLEEMFHAWQDQNHEVGFAITPEVILRREICAQKYLLKVAEKYKIPLEEIEVTRANLAEYEAQLKALLEGE